MAYASVVDLDEAYQVGQKAVELAAAGEGGYMVTIPREPGLAYRARLDKVPLEVAANSERKFLKEWIASNGYDADGRFSPLCPAVGGEEMVNSAAGGRPSRMARLQPIFSEKSLPAYVPQADRK